MGNFILGLLIGGLFGFIFAAIINVSRKDENDGI